MIRARQVTLIEAGDHTVARGIVAIDEREGAPPIIFFEGDAYLPAPEFDGEALHYRRTRGMHAGASFQAVR